MLEIYKGESDLSRRAVTYNLNELSFREFLMFKENLELSAFSLADILGNHQEIASELKEKIKVPVKHFKEYLKFGAYPYFLEDKKIYHDKLIRTVSLIIENDMNVVENVIYADSIKIKKLLIAIAESVPFTPNITKLSERLGVNRKFLLNAIKLLERGDLLLQLFKPDKGIGAFTKPEKSICTMRTSFMPWEKKVLKKEVCVRLFLQTNWGTGIN